MEKKKEKSEQDIINIRIGGCLGFLIRIVLVLGCCVAIKYLWGLLY